VSFYIKFYNLIDNKTISLN